MRIIEWSFKEFNLFGYSTQLAPSSWQSLECSQLGCKSCIMRKIWFVQSRRNLRKFPFFTTSNSTAKDFVLLAFFLLCFYFAKKPSIYKICICRRPFTHFKKKNINFHSSIKKTIRHPYISDSEFLEKVNNVDKSSVKIMYFGESMFKLQYYHQTPRR